ncbi:MAG: ABC transporter ATP-binding protein [Pseudomonadota bacterium]
MAADQTTPAIEVRGAVKRYGPVTALRGVSLDIADNEFFTLLGPSGCGKTTLLRMIAGFEDITEGAIRLFGDEIADLPPNRRPVNTVFQQYALFPHMTVAENVAFGLARLKRPKDDVRARTQQMLDLVKLGDFASRRPAQLSGGQQQRVALARAMAPGPKVLLLDEPLSALDLKLRQEMRVELKQLQQETGITFVFVTHDQEEALTMSDRIAVMSEGEVQQIGTAHDIYERPVNRFVADFIGETNLIDVTVAEANGETCTCRLPGGAEIQAHAAAKPVAGAAGHLSVRPERISLTGSGALSGTVQHTVYLGTDTQHIVGLADGSQITVRTQNAHAATRPPEIGARVGLAIDDGAARLLVD